MSILWSIFIGFIVGVFARALMPGRDPMGIVFTTLLGIGGAVVGRFLGQGIGLYKEGDPVGFFGSLIGAMILLFIYNQFVRKKQAL